MNGTILPSIGRNGLVNAVRRLGDANITGYRAVDSTQQFTAGMIAKLATVDGLTKVQVANNTDEAVIGIFNVSKVNSFYRPVINEPQAFPGGTNGYFTVNYANLDANSVLVTNPAGVAYAASDYDVDAVHGIITRTTSSSISSTGAVLVSYRYIDNNLTGIDQTLGSGNVSLIEAPAEVATLVYDTSKIYKINQKLYVNANGLITNVSGAVQVGIVTNPPTNNNPELFYKFIA